MAPLVRPEKTNCVKSWNELIFGGVHLFWTMRKAEQEGYIYETVRSMQGKTAIISSRGQSARGRGLASGELTTASRTCPSEEMQAGKEAQFSTFQSPVCQLDVLGDVPF